MRYEEEMPVTFASQERWSWHEQMLQQSRGDEIVARRESILNERRERDAKAASASKVVEGIDQVTVSNPNDLPILPQERRDSPAPFYPPVASPNLPAASPGK